MEKFNNISEKNPFKVPENYFEEVNRKIISATSGSGSEYRKISLYRKLKPYLAVAASLTLLVVMSYFAINFLSGRNKPEVPEITLNEFSAAYLNDINLLTLEEKAGSIDNEAAQISLSNKDIVDYFIFENIDINEINTQY